MGRKIVSDDKYIINVDPIFYVNKEDIRSHHPGSTTRYSISIGYRSNTISLHYQENKEARDAMFDKILKALEPRQNPPSFIVKHKDDK